jgi:hypothetical protein
MRPLPAPDDERCTFVWPEKAAAVGLLLKIVGGLA